MVDAIPEGARKYFGKGGLLLGAGTLLYLASLSANKMTFFVVIPLLAAFVAVGFLTAWQWGWKMLALPLPFSFMAGLEAYHTTPHGYDGADFIVIFLLALIASIVGVGVGLASRPKKIEDAAIATSSTLNKP